MIKVTTLAKRLGIVSSAVFAFCLAAAAQTNTFTYQGKLTDGAAAASGTYQMQFSLFGSMSGNDQIGTTVENPSVLVTNGIFTVGLDFSPASPFSTGANRWLEIGVRKASDPPGFTLLTPRQQITSSPYSVRTLFAGSADSLSSNCASCVTDAHVSDTITVGPGGSVHDSALPGTAMRTTGGTMTGPLNMGENVITNIGAAGTNFSPTGGLTLAGSLIVGANLLANGGTITDTLSMNNNAILNIGNAGTDFTGSGGLTLAGPLTANGSVSFPSDSITDAMVSNNLTINGGSINNTVIGSSTPAAGTFSSLTSTNPITGSVTGNAATATALQTARTINGIAFNGTTNITVPAAANTLTGGALAPGVTSSSLTTVGTLTALTSSGAINANGGVNLAGTTLSGTTAAIDFTNFDVAPSGNVTTAGTLTAAGNITFGSPALSVVGGVEQLRVLRGRINAAGQRVRGSGFTSFRQNIGAYVILFDSEFTDIPSCVATSLGGPARIVGTTAVAADLSGFNIRDAGGDPIDSDFNFICAGPR